MFSLNNRETSRTTGAAWRVLLEPTALTLILSLGAILLAGRWLPDFQPGRTTYLGLPSKDYWRIKMNWNACADVVLAGDSRIQVGVSPAHMADGERGLRIVNYAFAHAGYSQGYLDAVESVLDPKSPNRTIVLGITPLSLTSISEGQNEFLTQMKRKREGRLGRSDRRDFWEEHFPAAWRFLQPRRSIRDFQLTFSKGRYFIEYRRDGWLAARAEPPRPDGGVATYRKKFRRHKVRQEIAERVIRQVEKWRRDGIAVYGVRTPTNPAVRELENTASGFDAQGFAAAFEKVGGTWVVFDLDGWLCYDGTHLDRESAVRFSRELGKRIIPERE